MLEKWFEYIREAVAKAEADGEPKGACMVTNPLGGNAHCIMVDEKTCGKLKGTFLGGPCGATDTEPNAKGRPS
jgi:hypothetical protein